MPAQVRTLLAAYFVSSDNLHFDFICTSTLSHFYFSFLVISNLFSCWFYLNLSFILFCFYFYFVFICIYDVVIDRLFLLQYSPSINDIFILTLFFYFM